MKGSLNYHRGPIAASAEGIPACRGPKALQFFTRLAPAFSFVLAILLCTASPTARAESARPADAFVEFFGVNTHLGYYDTTYRDYEEIVKPRLLELVVRHIRDGTFNDDVLRKYLELGQHGIRLLFITDSRRAVERARKLRPVLFAIEGVNEPDGRKDDWVSRIQAEQRALYEAIKGVPATRDLPVAVSSLANLRDSPARLGDLTQYLDFGNMHPYAAGNPPSRHWGWGLSMERATAEAQKVSGDEPILGDRVRLSQSHGGERPSGRERGG